MLPADEDALCGLVSHRGDSDLEEAVHGEQVDGDEQRERQRRNVARQWKRSATVREQLLVVQYFVAARRFAQQQRLHNRVRSSAHCCSASKTSERRAAPSARGYTDNQTR